MTLYVTEKEFAALHDLNEKCQIKGKNSFDTEWWIDGLHEMFSAATMESMQAWAKVNKSKKIKVVAIQGEVVVCRLAL